MSVIQELRLKGLPISRGVAIGKPFFFTFIDDEVPEFSIYKKDVPKEIARYRRAVARSREDVRRLQRKLKKEKIAEGAAILDAHLHMMEDPLLTVHIEEEISKSRKNAEFVFHTIIKQYQKKFQSLADAFFRERFKDLQDISRRVMDYLLESVRVKMADIPKDSIVFSKELSASDAAEAKTSCIAAFVTTTGGETSHASIVAKAKGIPYVADVPFERYSHEELGKLVIVDGRSGEVIFHPTSETLKHYRQVHDKLTVQYNEQKKEVELPCETIDGFPIQLSANLDMTEDVEAFHLHGGKRVGLFRSEYIFLTSDTFPTEQEQFAIYKKLMQKMEGVPVVIRTFDFGGDKLMLNKFHSMEKNAILGSRAIRFLLQKPEIFKAQLRAIMRASVYGDMSILFPMISTLSELLEAKKLLKETYEGLKEDLPGLQPIRVGSMIEVPSAAIISDLIAKEVDFISIGTNDLVQYSLAVDRRNHHTHSLYSVTDPSVLRMIKLVVNEAQQIPVSVCGEVAADPRFTQLLIGLGIRELSVAPRHLPAVKKAVRSTTLLDAYNLAEKALSFTTSEKIMELISEEYKIRAPNDSFYVV